MDHRAFHKYAPVVLKGLPHEIAYKRVAMPRGWGKVTDLADGGEEEEEGEIHKYFKDTAKPDHICELRSSIVHG